MEKKMRMCCLGLAVSLGIGSLYADVSMPDSASSSDIQALQQKVARMEATLGPIQAQLAQLSQQLAQAKQAKQADQAKISTLNKKVHDLDQHQQRSDIKGKKLSALAQSVRKKSIYFDGEGQVFFEDLPTPTMANALLEHRDTFTTGALTLGGSIEADVQRWFGDSIPAKSGASSGTYRSGYGVSLASFDLDLLAQINDWVATYGSFVLNPDEEHKTYGTKLNQAFLTVGNLSQSPLFLSVGKMYVPFGGYPGGGPASIPLTRTAFKPGTQIQVMLGYNHDGLSTMLSAFNDRTSTDYHRHTNFAYGAFYTLSYNDALSMNLGASYVHNLIGLGSALGESSSDYPQGLPAWSTNVGMNYDIMGFSAEVIRGIYSNTEGKRPAAWSTTLSARPIIAATPTSMVLSYSATINMNGIAMSPTGNPTGINSLNAGIKNAWLVAVARPVFYHGLNVGVDVQYATTYDNNKTTTVSLDGNLNF